MKNYSVLFHILIVAFLIYLVPSRVMNVAIPSLILFSFSLIGLFLNLEKMILIVLVVLEIGFTLFILYIIKMELFRSYWGEPETVAVILAALSSLCSLTLLLHIRKSKA